MEKIVSDPFYFIEGRYMKPKKGAGGGVDTSGLAAATEQATQLQREIYEQTREDVQPWYDMGVGSVNRLADLLGVAGGSVQTRQQIYDDLLPQYTTQQQIPTGMSNMYAASDGRVYDLDALNNPLQLANLPGSIKDQINRAKAQRAGEPTYTTQDVIDYEGLNAAVSDALADQGTPDDYGSLLERFSLDKFEADPGYQFRQDEASKALERAMAAQGITLGGAGFGDINPTAYRAMEELNQGLASQEYGSAYNRYVQDQLNTFNMLMGAAGMGQNTTGILATGGQNYATNVGNLQTGLASAQLNADLASQANQGSMFGSLLGSALGGWASGGFPI